MTARALSARDRGELPRIDALERSRSIPELVALLDAPSWAVRRVVVAALAHLGEAAVAPLCAELELRRTSEARIAAAVDALVASRGEPDPVLLSMAARGDPAALVCDAAAILGRRRSRAALPALARLCRHQDDNVAVAGIEALGRIGPSGEGVDALLEVVDSGNFFRTFAAIGVLGRSQERRALEPLAALLGKPLYAAESMRALAGTGDEHAVAPLAALLTDADAVLTRTVAVALSALHDNADVWFASGAAVEKALNAAVQPAACAQRLLLAVPAGSAEEQAALCRLLSWLEHGSAEDALLSLLGTVPAAAAAAIAACRTEQQKARALHGGDSARRLLLLPLLDGKSELASTFLPCLDDPDPLVRMLACSALASAGDASAAPRLFELLRDDDRGVAQAAAGAIQSLGSPRTEELAIAAARSSDVREQRAGLRILAYFGYPSGLELLLAAVRSGDQRLRDVALPGLAFLEDPRALAALLELAQHPLAPARAAAMRALAQSEGTEEALLRLRAGLADRDAWVRYYACQALGRLADRDSAGAILQLMDDPAGQVRVAAVDALSALGGPRALAALLSAAASPDVELQHAALSGLGRTTSREALHALAAAASSPLAQTRLVALSAAARFGGAASIRLLCRCAADADEGVRAAALSLLGAHPAALIELLRCSDTRAAATAALARIGRPAAHAALFEALLSSEVEVRRSAAAALSAFDTNEARAVLERAIFDDPDPEVRRIGLTALVH